ncbi:MAG: BlaI/MecI/CopY family transcriptional regulator [Candidatus Kerfeldbacteria bacterium]|nr:BlaI/MecI/CopY family transcriptional regulator [Candidatus Kerfeldbacteria bacterium]
MPVKHHHLGELEQAIMDVLWQHGSATVRVVLGVLGRKRRIAYTTVMTVMGRLVDKGVLTRKADGASYTYRPTQPRQRFFERASRQAVDELLNSYGAVAVSAFLDKLEVTDPALVKKLKKRFGN